MPCVHVPVIPLLAKTHTHTYTVLTNSINRNQTQYYLLAALATVTMATCAWQNNAGVNYSLNLSLLGRYFLLRGGGRTTSVSQLITRFFVKNIFNTVTKIKTLKALYINRNGFDNTWLWLKAAAARQQQQPIWRHNRSDWLSEYAGYWI